MDDALDQSDGLGGRHARARLLAEKALAAQTAGDDDEADRLFAEADRIDPEAVANVLQERAGDPLPPRTGTDTAPQNDEDIAAMTRTIQPRSDAPPRSGITGPGSGADSQ